MFGSDITANPNGVARVAKPNLEHVFSVMFTPAPDIVVVQPLTVTVPVPVMEVPRGVQYLNSPVARLIRSTFGSPGDWMQRLNAVSICVTNTSNEPLNVVSNAPGVVGIISRRRKARNRCQRARRVEPHRTRLLVVRPAEE